MRDGDTTLVLELVERDPANRTGDPAKRLEYTLDVCCQSTHSLFSAGAGLSESLWVCSKDYG